MWRASSATWDAITASPQQLIADNLDAAAYSDSGYSKEAGNNADPEANASSYNTITADNTITTEPSYEHS